MSDAKSPFASYRQFEAVRRESAMFCRTERSLEADLSRRHSQAGPFCTCRVPTMDRLDRYQLPCPRIRHHASYGRARGEAEMPRACRCAVSLPSTVPAGYTTHSLRLESASLPTKKAKTKLAISKTQSQRPTRQG